MKISVTQNQPKSPFTLPLILDAFKTAAITFLLITIFAIPAIAQNNILVKGRITNETGQPVANASIVVKGSTEGTSTNDAGNFEINAPVNSTLVVTSVGYGTKEISVNNQQTLNISL